MSKRRKKRRQRWSLGEKRTAVLEEQSAHERQIKALRADPPMMTFEVGATKIDGVLVLAGTPVFVSLGAAPVVLNNALTQQEIKDSLALFWQTPQFLPEIAGEFEEILDEDLKGNS